MQMFLNRHLRVNVGGLAAIFVNEDSARSREDSTGEKLGAGWVKG
jgi:hypothetical protein